MGRLCRTGARKGRKFQAGLRDGLSRATTASSSALAAFELGLKGEGNMENLLILGVVIVGIIVVVAGLAFAVAKFYRTVEQGRALIINKIKREPIVTFTGSIVVPIIHRAEMMDISVKTIEIDRKGKEGLICKDNIRADIKVTSSAVLFTFTKKKSFPAPLRQGAKSDQPCWHHLCIVDDHHITSPQNLREITNVRMIDRLTGSIDQHQSRIRSIRESFLSDEFSRQIIVVPAEFITNIFGASHTLRQCSERRMKLIGWTRP